MRREILHQITSTLAEPYRVRVPLPPNVDHSFVPWRVLDKDGNGGGMRLSRFVKHHEARMRINGTALRTHQLEEIHARDPYWVAQSSVHPSVVFSSRMDI